MELAGHEHKNCYKRGGKRTEQNDPLGGVDMGAARCNDNGGRRRRGWPLLT